MSDSWSEVQLKFTADRLKTVTFRGASNIVDDKPVTGKEYH